MGLLHKWLVQLFDPRRAFRGIIGFVHYFSDWNRYRKLPNAEKIRLRDTWPQVHDKRRVHEVDAHYFYTNGWAMRRILATTPRIHVDIASQIIFSNLLAGIMPVIFVDYRPLEAKLTGLHCVGASLLTLPFMDSSIDSLSCLHVIEHIGLGRYGDSLDAYGTWKAARELIRVLSPGGNLFVAVPVGQPRLCFNAHRIFKSESIRNTFSQLDLIEFSGIHDDGRFVEHVDIPEFNNSQYACGLFWFQKNNV
jgi:SAM-dependent methyltransferase